MALDCERTGSTSRAAEKVEVGVRATPGPSFRHFPHALTTTRQPTLQTPPRPCPNPQPFPSHLPFFPSCCCPSTSSVSPDSCLAPKNQPNPPQKPAPPPLKMSGLCAAPARQALLPWARLRNGRAATLAPIGFGRLAPAWRAELEPRRPIGSVEGGRAAPFKGRDSGGGG